MQEPKLTYALRGDKMVSIEDVLRGLKCGCVCPKCKQPLEAKKGEIRQKHFAHLGEKAGYKPCHAYYMTALHMLAEQIIEEKKQVMRPEYKSLKRESLHFIEVEREQRNDRDDLQPDIVGVDANGVRWMIEIRNTHEVDYRKREKILELGANCLEIDVRDLSLEVLEGFLLHSDEQRKWINAPLLENIIIEKEEHIIRKLREDILNGAPIYLPPYNGVYGVKDKLSNVCITEEGHLTGRGEDGQEYLIFITPKRFNIEDYQTTDVRPDLAIFTISIDTDSDESDSISSRFWGHFPEYGSLPDRFIKKEVECLRKRYKGIKGKTDETCRKCPIRVKNGKCNYKLKDITYKSTTYHLCIRECKRPRQKLYGYGYNVIEIN